MFISYDMSDLYPHLNNIDISDDMIYKAIEAAGYAYDPMQDIFYAVMNPWQRKVGYCSLYDNAAPAAGIIIDCEPIQFEYAGKRWLIQFWKGQYVLYTGCEIGVYTTDKPDINIPGIFRGPFYQCADDNDLLNMSFTAIKNNDAPFKLKDKHWWLAGFTPGVFSEPSELKMDISITLKDEAMSNAFVKALIDVGYGENEILQHNNQVNLTFDVPRTKQPFTRTIQTDWIIQKRNQLLCFKYQSITGGYTDFQDKIMAVREQAPELYSLITSLGKNINIYRIYELIRDYIR
jgi:hypothetical protein